jgi:polyphosphate glucokinase
MGVDIGGSGIKSAIVDVHTGALVTKRQRTPTPEKSTPDAVARIVRDQVEKLEWSGVIGATFPAVIKDGIARSAANVDKSWIGTDVDQVFTNITGLDVTVLNDADAAGLAEVRFGAAAGVRGVVIMLTFGTGIGSGIFLDGQLVPNSELGHLELNGKDAEREAAASIKDREDLSYKQWAKRVQAYMAHVESLFSPDLFIVGGGVSKDADRWVPLLDLQTPVKPAELLNNAGIVGAALAASESAGE